MKRSEINGRIRDAMAFFESHRFFLPPFAGWTPEDWARRAVPFLLGLGPKDNGKQLTAPG